MNMTPPAPAPTSSFGLRLAQITIILCLVLAFVAAAVVGVATWRRQALPDAVTPPKAAAPGPTWAAPEFLAGLSAPAAAAPFQAQAERILGCVQASQENAGIASLPVEPNAIENFRSQLQVAAEGGKPPRAQAYVDDAAGTVCTVLLHPAVVEHIRLHPNEPVLYPLVRFHLAQWDRQREAVARHEAAEAARVQAERQALADRRTELELQLQVALGLSQLVTQMALLVVGVVAFFVVWTRIRLNDAQHAPQPERAVSPVVNELGSRVAPFARPVADPAMDGARR